MYVTNRWDPTADGRILSNHAKTANQVFRAGVDSPPRLHRRDPHVVDRMGFERGRVIHDKITQRWYDSSLWQCANESDASVGEEEPAAATFMDSESRTPRYGRDTYLRTSDDDVWGSRVRVGYSRSGQPSKTYELHGNTPHDPTGEIRSMSA
jgi:hypothetical protein